MNSRCLTRLATSIVALATLLITGCAGNPGVAPSGDDPGQLPEGCVEPGLYLVGPQALTVQAGSSVGLQVRFACDSQPYPGVLMSFAITGDARGSQLSALSATTADDGIATVTLVAGAEATTFSVAASVPGVTPVSYAVTVSTAATGTVVVNMTYTGEIAFTEYRAFLFQNRTCSTMDPFSLTGALQQAAPVPGLMYTPTFPDVPAGANYAVAVQARRHGELLGFGCTGTLPVSGGQETTARVTILDIDVSYTGTYGLDNRFDMSDLLPEDVDGIVHIFDEMTDDHALNGDLGLDQWGVDPAAFLLDFIYREFCKWECTNDNASWDNCDPGVHPTGDIKETYRSQWGSTPFLAWDGNEPRYPMLCGILDPLWGMSQQVQTQVQDILPENVINILGTIGDISRAITKMHVTSTLSLDNIRPGRQGNFTHQLETMFVDLHDFNGNLHTFEIDLAAAGVGTLYYSGNTTVTNDQLQIPAHVFRLKFGKLVQYIYLNYLLPLLDCAPPNNNTACLFAQVVDCDDVGQWLYDACTSAIQDMFGGSGVCPVGPNGFAGFCGFGLQAAGLYVDLSMDDWIGGETELSLSGQCSYDELDDHRNAISVKDGVWTGYWADSSSNASVSGTFTGARR